MMPKSESWCLLYLELLLVDGTAVCDAAASSAGGNDCQFVKGHVPGKQQQNSVEPLANLRVRRAQVQHTNVYNVTQYLSLAEKECKINTARHIIMYAFYSIYQSFKFNNVSVVVIRFIYTNLHFFFLCVRL